MGQENIRIRPEESEDYFGPLYPYIMDRDITDIDFNGREIWLTNCKNERTMGDVNLTSEFVDQFTKRISNAVSKPFHKMAPVLEAETDTLRITIVHESVCQGVRAFCIRKSLPTVRLTEESAIDTGYASREMIDFLKSCVRARLNMVFAGNPGVGKTECAKFFSQYIPAKDRVITIEDTPEWHYSSVNPGKDCIEFKISPSMDYTQAIKTSLRLNPTWMFLSEARSTEVRYLLEGFSTGVRGMTTLHTDDVRKVPDRIVNMAGQEQTNRILNDTYAFVDVAVLLKRREVKDATGFISVKRYIDQICFFDRDGNVNRIHMVAENGQMLPSEIPEGILRKFQDAGVEVPKLIHRTEAALSPEEREVRQVVEEMRMEKESQRILARSVSALQGVETRDGISAEEQIELQRQETAEREEERWEDLRKQEAAEREEAGWEDLRKQEESRREETRLEDLRKQEKSRREEARLEELQKEEERRAMEERQREIQEYLISVSQDLSRQIQEGATYGGQKNYL